MAIPPEFLEELRRRTTLSSVVGKRVRLVKKGREFSGLCPFHNEKTPSFFVNDDKAFYNCFGCGKHGDAVSFVIETEGLTFLEAVERLAGEAGLEVPRVAAVDPAERARRAGAEAAVEAACVFFER
ncbi:MAG: DNA primase, partial [Alphaproteobacteria bacterium]|nr:DNA primase [Alphaproteobacteria bacterium]